MPKLEPYKKGGWKLVFSPLESLACHKLYRRPKEHDNHKRKVLYKIINW